MKGRGRCREEVVAAAAVVWEVEGREEEEEECALKGTGYNAQTRSSAYTLLLTSITYDSLFFGQLLLPQFLPAAVFL